MSLPALLQSGCVLASSSGVASHEASRPDSDADESILHIPDARTDATAHATASPGKRRNKRKRGRGFGRLGAPDTRYGRYARYAVAAPRVYESAVGETQVLGSSALLPRTDITVPMSLREVYRYDTCSCTHPVALMRTYR